MFFVHGSRAGDEAPFPPVNNFYVLAKGVNRSRRSGWCCAFLSPRGWILTKTCKVFSGAALIIVPLRVSLRHPFEPSDVSELTTLRTETVSFSPTPMALVATIDTTRSLNDTASCPPIHEASGLEIYKYLPSPVDLLHGTFVSRLLSQLLPRLLSCCFLLAFLNFLPSFAFILLLCLP